LEHPEAYPLRPGRSEARWAVLLAGIFLLWSAWMTTRAAGAAEPLAMEFRGTLGVSGDRVWVTAPGGERLALPSVDGRYLQDYHGVPVDIAGLRHLTDAGAGLQVTRFALAGSALDMALEEIVRIYNSPIPNPPHIPIDLPRALGSLETGDLVIENPRMHPHWYIAVSSLFPGSRYVHGGIAVKGHALIGLRRTMAELSGKPVPFVTYRRQQDGGTSPWQYLPEPEIRPQAVYVVSQEVRGPDGICGTIAMAAEDVLVDPRFPKPGKHILILRPPVRTQKQLAIALLYLGYHLTLFTPYDMAFSTIEPETGFRVAPDGQVTIDWEAAPPTVYCTELPWRALALAGVRSSTMTMAPALVGVMRRLPMLPREMVEAWCGPQVPPEVFRRPWQVTDNGKTRRAKAEVIYANQLPPTPLEVLESLPDSILKRWYLSLYVTHGLCRR